MSQRIRQALAAYVLAVFIGLALATSTGPSVSEIALMWARRPAIVLAHDPDELGGELSLPDDEEEQDYSFLDDFEDGDWEAYPPLSDTEALELARRELPPDPATDPDGYITWFTAKMPPKQALMWRLLPDTIELPTDIDALRQRYN